MTKSRDGKTFGAPAFTYISEKNMERRLGRALNTEVDSRPMVWGKFCEPRIFNLLPTEYTHSSQETKQHPNFNYWAGSKDGLKYDEGKTVYDFKAPSTHKSFCNLVDPIYEGLTGLAAMEKVRENHSDGDKFYWQLVSNSIIDQTKFAELIVYMPYKSELDDIRAQANQSGDPKHYWIWSATDDELPWIQDDGFYTNINIIRFEVPLQDKLLLAKTVQEAALRLHDPANPLPKMIDQKASASIPVDPSSLLKKIS
jgi:hypothetical protein